MRIEEKKNDRQNKTRGASNLRVVYNWENTVMIQMP
jgi:hypothetical protein